MTTIVAGRRVVLFPLAALGYFIISLILLTGVLFFIEHRVIPHLEDERRLAGIAWKKEDERINRNIKIKNLADEDCPIWRSDGFPVTPERRAEHRILVVGDSFVWGASCANMNDMWWRQLARELHMRGYEDVEVIAAGLSGKSTHQEITFTQALVADYKPDLIIWGYVTNDPDEKRIHQLNLEHRKLLGLLEDHGQHLFPNLLQLLHHLRQHKLEPVMKGEEHGYPYAEWEMRLLEGENFQLFSQTVERLGEFQRDSGIPGFVMTLPIWPGRQYYEPRYAPLKPLFARAGVPFYDILGDFAAAYPGTDSSDQTAFAWGINPANGHPGPKTLHFYAVEAANLLERQYADVLGPKTAAPPNPLVYINDWMPWFLKVHQGSGGKAIFKFPSDDNDFVLRMPIRRPFVQLSFENAVALRAIRLRGKGLTSGELYLSSVDPKLGYDDGTFREVGVMQGTDCTWALPQQDWANHVNSVRISARFTGDDHHVAMTFTPKKGKA